MIRQCTVLPVLILALVSTLVLGRQAGAQQTCTGTVPLECDDGEACTADACDLTSHTCSHAPLGPEQTCEDGNACTQGDFCQSGICVGGNPIAGCISCTDNAQCDDGDACTTDACDLGVCQHTGAESCDDGDPCTIGDRCANGTCAGVPLDCNDGASCTDDFCDDGACVHQPVDDRCATTNECVQTQCLPGPGTDARGCVSDSAPFEATACSEDQNPCTVDRCRAGACAHDPVDDPSGCSPVVPSYRRALDLRAGVERLLAYMNDEAQVGGDTGSRLDDDLGAVAADLDGAAAILAGRVPEAGQPQGLVRPARGVQLAADTIAQQRGRVALLWARGAPAHVLDFLGRLSSGRRHGDLTPDAARELRRNGRILLVGTKNLKRDVKNLQRTFSVFQR